MLKSNFIGPFYHHFIRIGQLWLRLDSSIKVHSFNDNINSFKSMICTNTINYTYLIKKYSIEKWLYLRYEYKITVISIHTYFSRFTTKAVVAWCEIRLNKNWINPRKTVKRIIEILTMFTEIYIYRVLK